MQHRLAYWTFLATVLVSTTLAEATTSRLNIKTDIQKTGLQFFLDNAHPKTGLVRDRAENFDVTPDWNRVASISSTGFGLAVVANAATRGQIKSSEAQDYVLKTLRFTRDHVARRKGWLLHFVDWETGARVWSSEYSTIDTALFMAGALYAAQVFPGNKEINDITRALYQEIDFIDMLTDGGAKPDKRTLSMAFFEEDGFTQSQWNMYAEQMILLVLGLGHPTRPLPTDTWLAWDRKTRNLPDSRPVMGLEAALFIHQYSEIFLDLREFSDGFPNYHENSRLMTSYHRALARTDQRFKSLKAGFWGFSAGDSPAGYRVWSPTDYQGTVCIGCVTGSAMYALEGILDDVIAWVDGPYRQRVWGKYGLADSVDLDNEWFSTGVFGITVGPSVLAVADADDTTSVWKSFMRIPEIQRGLFRASHAVDPQSFKKASAH